LAIVKNKKVLECDAHDIAIERLRSVAGSPLTPRSVGTFANAVPDVRESLARPLPCGFHRRDGGSPGTAWSVEIALRGCENEGPTHDWSARSGSLNR
jgi:hypothetical protein